VVSANPLGALAPIRALFPGADDDGGGGARGVRAFASLLHAGGKSAGGQLEAGQGVRVCVYCDSDRRPVGATRAPSALSSFLTSAHSATSELTLLAGQSYTVVAQWSRRDVHMIGNEGRAVSLQLTVSGGAAGAAAVSISIPGAGPQPILPFAPAESAFGDCGACHAPLPPEFSFVNGMRLHAECTPRPFAPRPVAPPAGGPPPLPPRA
jgi:hypothetical protein